MPARPRGFLVWLGSVAWSTLAEVQRCSKCQKEPHYELSACPLGAAGCLNIVNQCNFPVWPVMTSGSPPLVEFQTHLVPGGSTQFTFPAVRGSDWGQGGRINLYYKDPATIPHNPNPIATHGRYPCLAQTFMQLVEFGLFWDSRRQAHFLDFDLSQVDHTAIPTYAYGGNNCNGRPGQTCTNKECVRAYSVCSPSQLLRDCPCEANSVDAVSGVGQCQSPRTLCSNPANAGTKCCRVWDQDKYRRIANGTNTPAIIAGCVCDHVDCKKCIAINRGICIDPSDASRCPHQDWDQPSNWYDHGLDQNEYAKWVFNTWNNSYGFSLDEGELGGNSQCRDGTQLDVVLCPTCNRDDPDVHPTCKVGDQVRCPGTTTNCAGDQCCPDGTTWVSKA